MRDVRADSERMEKNMGDLETGRVWLVGAGPSDPGLFTLKGREVLEKAEVVVYDALAGQGILNMIPKQAEAIDVGKRSSHHKMRQEKINELLVQKAKEGKRVVRLKGGDPYLFGRGGEELELLVKEGIPYEIVPGVTSALAVPAYQGIPVTHRDYCSSVHIITGHRRDGFAGQTEKSSREQGFAESEAPGRDYGKGSGKLLCTTQPGTAGSENLAVECEAEDTVSLGIDFEALVRTKGTLVFLMGVASLGAICHGLLQAGMDPAMPAALLMQGTTAAQRRVVATVSTLEEEVKKNGAKTPAIIVVGKVCALAEEFSWYEKQPLGGVKILLTRPRELVSETARKLRVLGAEVVELPAIRTDRIEENKKLYAALKNLPSYQWVVFTSPTGVRIFFEEMAGQRTDCRLLAKVKFAVIGGGTQKELEKHGYYADLIPEVFDGEHLGRALAEICEGDERILIPRASIGNKELTEILAGKNLWVDDIATYNTSYETDGLAQERGELSDGNIHYVLFTSASSVRGFAAAIGEMDYSLVKAVCIGKQTKAAADRLGMQTWMSERASIDSLIERLLELVHTPCAG